MTRLAPPSRLGHTCRGTQGGRLRSGPPSPALFLKGVKEMQVYEIGWEDEPDNVIWLATDCQIFTAFDACEIDKFYCKKIDISHTEPGVDLIIQHRKETKNAK